MNEYGIERRVFDALAAMDSDIAVIATQDGQLALVSLTEGWAWLVSMIPARFVMATRVSPAPEETELRH